MSTVSKRRRPDEGKVDKDRTYGLEEGLDLLKSSAKVRFDEAIDVAVNLGIDPKKSDQGVRGAVSLPNGTGRSRSVIAFVKDPAKQEAAREAGAAEVGDDELVAKVAAGWTGFDVAIAAPDMMGQVGKLGKVLGPQGKMPTPKSGTVTPNVAEAVKAFAAGKVEFRADAGGTVHAAVGKRSFDTEKLAENVRAFITALNALKPATSKGTYLKKVVVSSTMGPGVMVDTSAPA
ncbi:MAG: 50S ribosomal protein L1 [Planctomycetota bacterium]|nr:MAG: 50S ribosomal protein L1 [Planctomycetota bacterium]